MRYRCYVCGKSVTSKLPDDSVIRAMLICPECIEGGRIRFPDETGAADPDSIARRARVISDETEKEIERRRQTDPRFSRKSKPLADREPLDHNGECIYCDEPALTVADHAPRCVWRLAVEAAYPLPPDHPDRKPEP